MRVSTTRATAAGTFTIRQGGYRIGAVAIDWTKDNTPLTVFNFNNKKWVPFTTRAAAIAWVVAEHDAHVAAYKP